MLNNHELIETFTNDVNRVQEIIEHRRLYNIRNIVVGSLLKSGIAIDCAFPFLLSAIIIGSSQNSKGNVPFRIDEIKEKASIETVDTSSGVHLEHISYDFSYDDEFIEHSTGWQINENGLYERTVTSYRLNDDIDLDDTEKIMSMTKEDIEQLLAITNIRTIKKNILTPEDSIYDSDAIIVVNHTESEEEMFTRFETTKENFWNSIKYIISVLWWGNVVRISENLFVKTYIRDILRKYEPSFRRINKKELERMREVLKVKQENLAMLNSEAKNISEEDGHSYRLRKK